MNTSISVLLERKGSGIFSVPSTITAAAAVMEMNRHKIGAVLVMDGERLVGIFTERDVLSRGWPPRSIRKPRRSNGS